MLISAEQNARSEQNNKKKVNSNEIIADFQDFVAYSWT